MNNIAKSYIITYTGKKFNLLQPRRDDISIIDIAHALGMQCRWTGHAKHHYSIAQHSVYCSYIGPKSEALHRLLHDASESYIGDMNRPLKHYTNAGDAYRLVEQPLQDLIYEVYGLPAAEPASVKFADQSMLYAEMQQLLPELAFETDNDVFEREVPADVVIQEWTPVYAEKMFLDRFIQLYFEKEEQQIADHTKYLCNRYV
jgi:uncharacterized protein